MAASTNPRQVPGERRPKMTTTTQSQDTASHTVSPRHALQYRSWLRRQAQAVRYAPIRVVDGAKAPQQLGESGYWTTPSGAICRHPSAYRRAFGRPVYNASTVRVEVGREWLAEHRIPEQIAVVA